MCATRVVVRASKGGRESARARAARARERARERKRKRARARARAREREETLDADTKVVVLLLRRGSFVYNGPVSLRGLVCRGLVCRGLVCSLGFSLVSGFDCSAGVWFRVGAAQQKLQPGIQLIS
jgi:hypothetical protein